MMIKMHSARLRASLAAAGLLLLAACDRSPKVSVEDAVVTLPALRGQPGAAYFNLETNAPPERLLRVESDAAARIELHETMREDGMAGMAPLQSPAFAPDGTLSFQPGGRHAMLFGLTPGLAVGGKAKLTFIFDQAPPVSVEADVRGPGQGRAEP